MYFSCISMTVPQAHTTTNATQVHTGTGGLGTANNREKGKWSDLLPDASRGPFLTHRIRHGRVSAALHGRGHRSTAMGRRYIRLVSLFREETKSPGADGTRCS